MTPDDSARIVAWNLYVARVEDVLRGQWEKFRDGRESPPIVFAPPLKEQVEIITRALANARIEGADAVLSATKPDASEGEEA